MVLELIMMIDDKMLQMKSPTLIASLPGHGNNEKPVIIIILAMSPPMEAAKRKLRRALDPVRAMEGVPSTLKA